MIQLYSEFTQFTIYTLSSQAQGASKEQEVFSIAELSAILNLDINKFNQNEI